MTVYNESQIKRIRAASGILGQVLKELRGRIEPGISTYEIDKTAENLILKAGVRPAFKGYRGFPACICASVNEQVVHGIPDKKTILREGDIVGVDIGVEGGGYFADAAVTVPVGRVAPETARLVAVTGRALELGIAKALAGGRLHDISSAIQTCAEEAGFSVVRNFVGHGIGSNLHEDPQIPNFGRPGTGPKLQAGMVLALEPMVNAGSWEVKLEKDQWTATTADGRLSAHFEHTVLVTSGEPEILTAA